MDGVLCGAVARLAAVQDAQLRIVNDLIGGPRFQLHIALALEVTDDLHRDRARDQTGNIASSKLYRRYCLRDIFGVFPFIFQIRS